MSKRKKPQFYAVAKGRNPGIYHTWDECKSQVVGFSGAKYKGFPSEQAAQSYITEHRSTGPAASLSPGTTQSVLSLMSTPTTADLITVKCEECINHDGAPPNQEQCTCEHLSETKLNEALTRKASSLAWYAFVMSAPKLDAQALKRAFVKQATNLAETESEDLDVDSRFFLADTSEGVDHGLTTLIRYSDAVRAVKRRHTGQVDTDQ